MPSTRLCLQPYLLSNFDLVTESLTLIAGNLSVPATAISYSRCTPVVVSSVTPMICSPPAVHLPGVAATERPSTPRTTAHSPEPSPPPSPTPPPPPPPAP